MSYLAEPTASADTNCSASVGEEIDGDVNAHIGCKSLESQRLRSALNQPRQFCESPRATVASGHGLDSGPDEAEATGMLLLLTRLGPAGLMAGSRCQTALAHRGLALCFPALSSSCDWAPVLAST